MSNTMIDTAPVSRNEYSTRMQELHAGHAARIERLAAVAAAHARHNASLERVLRLPRRVLADPFDLKVLYEMAPEAIIESISRGEVVSMLDRNIARRSR